ncbi:MAG: LptE family protein [Simkaniaceae bacterium]|nr:LptE family protein [Simkaniaceae bacterium]
MHRKLNSCFLLCSCLLIGCGYHLDNGKGHTLSVPYVKGDIDGALTDELIRQVAILGKYTLVGGEGEYRLEVKIIHDEQNVIGYEYDHQENQLYNRLVSNEERRLIEVEVTLIDQSSGKIVLGPEKVRMGVEYDFVDPESLPDVVVSPSSESTLSFSLGQLDSIEGARAGSLASLHRKLAQKIAAGL